MKQLTGKAMSVVLLSAGLMITAPVLAQPMPQAQEQNGITYITGGVGVDEAKAIESMRGRYNLHMTVTAKNGDFLAYVPVKVMNSRKQMVLDTKTNGPYLFAQLPAGRYEVIAGGDNTRAQKRTVQVGARGGANLHFVF